MLEFKFKKRTYTSEIIELNYRTNQKYHLFDKQIIINIFKNNPNQFLSLKKIKKLYEAKDPCFKFSIFTLRKFLKLKMKAMYKNAKFKTYRGLTNSGIAQLSLFIKKIADILRNKNKINFFDETKISNPKTQKKRWIIKEVNEQISYPGRLKSKNLLLAAGPYNLMHYKISENNNNTSTVIKFLKSLFHNLKDNDQLSELQKSKKVWILIDSASTHTSKKMKTFMKESGFNFTFPPCYYP